MLVQMGVPDLRVKTDRPGAGFLDERAPAGALIARTEERATWFSVNGRTGHDFKDNEGFYEFDVELKEERVSLANSSSLYRVSARLLLNTEAWPLV